MEAVPNLLWFYHFYLSHWWKSSRFHLVGGHLQQFLRIHVSHSLQQCPRSTHFNGSKRRVIAIVVLYLKVVVNYVNSSCALMQATIHWSEIHIVSYFKCRPAMACLSVEWVLWSRPLAKWDRHNLDPPGFRTIDQWSDGSGWIWACRILITDHHRSAIFM